MMTMHKRSMKQIVGGREGGTGRGGRRERERGRRGRQQRGRSRKMYKRKINNNRAISFNKAVVGN